MHVLGAGSALSYPYPKAGEGAASTGGSPPSDGFWFPLELVSLQIHILRGLTRFTEHGYTCPL